MTPQNISEQVNPDELFNVVSNAASQNPALVIASTERLKAMLLMAGTFDLLSQIVGQRSLPLAMRQLSIIQMKNAAPAQWRGRRLLTDEQRVQIRGRTLSLLDEEDETVAECNAIIIAKIARNDYPNHWRNLIPDLLAIIDSNISSFTSSNGTDARAALLLRRSLSVLNATLKELSVVKMPNGIRIMGALAEQLSLVLERHYSTLALTLNTLLTPPNFGSQNAALHMQITHKAFKCLAQITTWLWHRQHLNNYKELSPWVHTCFQNSVIQLRVLYDLRINIVSSFGPGAPISTLGAAADRTLDFLTRHVRQFGKLFRRMQQLSTAKFVALPTCSNLVLYYWSKVVQATNGPSSWIQDSPSAVFPVRLLVQAMVLFKESLAQWTPAKQGPNSLSQDFVEEAVRLLVTRFIPLNPKDLDAWSADPEEWVNVEDAENDQWEYELRPCAERVLMVLASQYAQFVAPLLSSTFVQVNEQPTITLDHVVQKEALYCAIGRCAIRLRGVVPFDEWLSRTAAAEVRETNQNFPIIKRRIAWVIGKWVSDECVSPNNSIIWEIFVHLLADRGPGTDTVVRLTAATALRDCVDALKFEADGFVPYLPAVINRLVHLTAEADTLESKKRILRTLDVIIERMEKRVVPYIQIIVNAVPELWTMAEGDYLFKASLLESMTKVVNASKDASSTLSVIVVPLVQESFSTKENRLHLDEDGLRLWKAALFNTVTTDSVNGAPSLYSLVPTAIELLAENLDLLGSILSVMQSYCILCGERILRDYGVPLLRAFVKALGQAPTTNVKDCVETLHLLVHVASAQAWAEPMLLSELFTKLLQMLDEEKAATLILTEIIYVLARMAMADAGIFVQLISADASRRGMGEISLWKTVLDQWWQRFDNMSEPRYRKLAAMGIACLVATGRPEVLDRLNGEIFNLWLDVFGEIKEATKEATDESADGFRVKILWEDTGFDSSPYVQEVEGTPEYDRRKAIHQSDPVTSEKLTAYVAQRVQRAQEVVGHQRFEALVLQSSDPTVLEQLYVELSSGI